MANSPTFSWPIANAMADGDAGVRQWGDADRPPFCLFSIGLIAPDPVPIAPPCSRIDSNLTLGQICRRDWFDFFGGQKVLK
jgi:hypothetical protein